MKVPFFEVLRRITGISTPLGGISWEIGEGESEIAARVVTFLEDRRVIDPDHFDRNVPQPLYSRKSIEQIRAFLGKEMQKLPRRSELFRLLGRMRAACRDCISKLEDDYLSVQGLPTHVERTAVVIDALSSFRAQISICLALLSTQYRVEVDERLLSLLPGDDIDTPVKSNPRMQRKPTKRLR